MTADAEISRLDARVTRLETSVFDKLESIDDRLNKLAVAIAGRRECPDPGACISLTGRVNEARDIMLNLSNRVSAIERWQYAAMAIMGACSIVGPTIVAIVGMAIKWYFKI
jgi:hypothetical protein